MTRKDYVNLAEAVRAAQGRIAKDIAYSDEQLTQQLRGVRRLAASICDTLMADNPKGFDPVIFLRNCGYGVRNMREARDVMGHAPIRDEDETDAQCERVRGRS